MSQQLFGTDGVRGVANTVLTADLALAVGRAAGRYLGGTGTVVIGRDTRVSGPMIESALAAGFNSAGVATVSLGIVPTPTVSHAVRSGGGFALGVVVSASHNPALDNGVKFFGPDGKKLSDASEAEIERLMAEPFTPGAVGAGLGPVPQLVEAYLEWLIGIADGRLEGMVVAMDAAHGAAAFLGPRAFERMGCQVVATGVSPDGHNINAEGGATKPHRLTKLVKETGAAVGVSFDGDADRAIFCDVQGRLINGDRVIGAWAAHHHAKAVVGTVMSNGGYERWLTTKGIRLERADVGDKYVAARMAEIGAPVGGEQSGHLIFPAHSPTGDGLLTAVEFLRVLAEEHRSAADIYDEFENLPQIMVNVGVASKDGWETILAPAIEEARLKVGDRGRVSVRASGTEPKLRVMVESDDAAFCDAVIAPVVEVIEREMGGVLKGRVDLTHALGD